MDAVQVLLVEDDAADARLLREGLAGQGHAPHQVEHVTSLAEARDRLACRPRPDVVLLDLSLPDSSGLDTLDRLLADTPVPVVVLTGLDDDDLARTAIERGAEDYLVKGTVTGEAVARAVRHAIERHRLQAQLRERAKEMAGLLAISQVLQEHAPAEEICTLVAGLLVDAMQWPDTCRAEVRIDEVVGAHGPGPDEVVDTLTAEVTSAGRVRGRVLVGYADPGLGFLPEEQRVVDATAGAIAGWLQRRDAQEQLFREEERLRALVSQLPGMVWTTDRDLLATSYAGASLAEVGIADDRFVGTSIIDVMGTTARSEVLALFRRALDGESLVFERPWRGRWWRNHLQARRDGAGRIVGTVCLTLDITTEHDQAVELDAARERLEGLFANASDAMVLADDDGTYIDANPAAAALTGFTRAELVGMHPWDLVADEVGTDPVAGHALWQDFVREGELAGEFPLRRRDGDVVVTDFRAVANIVPGVHLATMRDITHRARAEAALAASEELFRTMAESAQDAIYRLRLVPEPRYEYMNPAVATMTGFPPEAFQADPMLFMDRMDPADVPQTDQNLPAPGSTRVHRLRFRHADGRWVWLEDNRTAIAEDGRTVGVQGVVRDITNQERTRRAMQVALEAERRAAERLRAAAELKNAFLSAVSHELRTPLTSVRGYAETLATRGDQLSSEQVRDMYRRLASNAVRLEQLLVDLLDVGRLSQGMVRLERSATDLTALVRETVLALDVGERRVVVDPAGAVAHVDPRMVERIVHNLLANAVRHTHEGSTIWASCQSGPAGATIVVADDGPGVDPADRDHVFEPFWQGLATRDAASPGTGIGLALVRQLAVLHGGSVVIDERPGGGALFTVTLPSAASGGPGQVA